MNLPKKKVTQSMLDPRYAKEVAKVQAKGIAHKKTMTKKKPKYVKDYTSNKTLDGLTQSDVIKKTRSAFDN